MIDWEDLLQQYGVAYQHDGRRNIRVDCPWCNDGGGANMVISLHDRGWKCWANFDHRGLAPARLLAALTGLSLDRARLITGSGSPRSLSVDTLTQVQQMLAPPQAETAPPELQMPREFHPLALDAAARPFVAYLQRRGFARARIARFTAEHGLYYAREGRWRYRVIFTITQHGKLCGWTGRSIAEVVRLRYLTAGAEDGAMPITDTLPWFDRLTTQLGRKNRLVLVEGPFDALKLWELGESATCCFTAAPSPRQIDLLREVLPHYRRCVLLLDRDTTAMALRARRAMVGLPVEVVTLRHKKDPGEIADRAELDSILGAA